MVVKTISVELQEQRSNYIELKSKWEGEEVKTILSRSLEKRGEERGDSWKERQVFIHMGEMRSVWIQQRGRRL